MAKDVLNKHYVSDPIADRVLNGTYTPRADNFSTRIMCYGVAVILYLIFIFHDFSEKGLSVSVCVEALFLFLCFMEIIDELKK